MTINDVIMFSKKENINLEYYEYLKIFEKIKNNWKILVKDNNIVKEFLDDNFNKEKSEKIYNLFLKYKKKYSSYL